MIKILHVVTHMNRGGLETMIMNYYRHIDRNCIQFDFLTHRPYDGDYGHEIRALGGIIHHISPLNPFSNAYKMELRSFFLSHPEYQIIHVHQDCMSSVILKEAEKCGIPVRIAHSHSTSQDKNMKYLIKMVYKRKIAAYATDLFACSVAAGKWMFNGASFQVLNNAIDAGKYSYNLDVRKDVRESYFIKPEDLVIGHVGRFCEPKNHTFLIDIFEQILQIRPDAKLLLVGNDQENYACQIKEKVVKHNLQDNVIFAGLRSDVHRMLQAMDVFVFPSLYEGLPVTLVEAQAAGLRCIISDRVPIECKKTDLVEQISLSESPLIWAQGIVSEADYRRMDHFLEISRAGYDIVENAKWLESYYMSKLR